MSSGRNRRLRPIHVIGLAVATAALALGTASMSFGDAPLTGAIFTTDQGCTGTDLNIYDAKDDVYLDGGPTHTGAAGLPDGYYYVQVTDPSGNPVLGTSVGSTSETPVHVTDGVFDDCYQLSKLVWKSGSDPLVQGFNDTTNPGGEYKVWVSDRSDFDTSKTDNFQVKEIVVPPPPQSTLHVTKYYDANANGLKDVGESDITGWQVNLTGDQNNPYLTPHDFVVTPGTYTVGEGTPVQTNWFHTTDTSVTTTVADGDTANIKFGNVCIGGGTGALTLGYWSNKNGQKATTAADLTFLAGLNLRNANGSDFNPTSTSGLSSWLLNANATNMAYMLSAQLAAMELNVRHGVDGNALVYAPGATGANAAGFITVNALMIEANMSLGTNPLTIASGSVRTYQEALKTALDKANNNLNFVQSSPCTFSFPSSS
jgi:hypothetical protein